MESEFGRSRDSQAIVSQETSTRFKIIIFYRFFVSVSLSFTAVHCRSLSFSVVLCRSLLSNWIVQLNFIICQRSSACVFSTRNSHFNFLILQSWQLFEFPTAMYMEVRHTQRAMLSEYGVTYSSHWSHARKGPPSSSDRPSILGSETSERASKVRYSFRIACG